MNDRPDPLHLPPSWASSELSTLAGPAEAGSALRAGLPQDSLANLSVDSDFTSEFWSRLNGPNGHVMLEFPSSFSSVGAATLIAAWMGLTPGQVHEDIGGTVSHVVSGVGHRHDQSWHTDSTPWREPNLYSVLGLLSGDGADDQSTDLFALSSLDPHLASDSAAWTALKTESIPWRRNFPGFPDLSAPILGQPHPRWVWPVFESLMHELSSDLQRGISLVARLANELPHDSAVVSRSTILVFNNGRMLHRGPHLEQSSGRELIRIKVAGKALG